MFKPANRDSRIPTYLQAHTKENIIFQLALVVMIPVVSYGYEKYDEHKHRSAAWKAIKNISESNSR